MKKRNGEGVVRKLTDEELKPVTGGAVLDGLKRAWAKALDGPGCAADPCQQFAQIRQSLNQGGG